MYRILFLFGDATTLQYLEKATAPLKKYAWQLCSKTAEAEELLLSNTFHFIVVYPDEKKKKLFLPGEMFDRLLETQQCPVLFLNPGKFSLFHTIPKRALYEELEFPFSRADTKMLHHFFKLYEHVLSYCASCDLPCFLTETHSYYLEVPYQEILYFEAKGRYSLLRTLHGQFYLPIPFRQLQIDLENTCMIRTHRSFFINPYHIDRVNKGQLPWIVSFRGCSDQAMISRKYYQEVAKKLNELVKKDCMVKPQ